MKQIGSLTVGIEIESLCKVYCTNFSCIYNLADSTEDGLIMCNLKHIVLGKNGKCESMKERNK